MKSEDVKALVSHRMEKSKEAIKAAEILLENEMLTFSMNRVYYSMFYAVQALLAVDGVSSKPTSLLIAHALACRRQGCVFFAAVSRQRNKYKVSVLLICKFFNFY